MQQITVRSLFHELSSKTMDKFLEAAWKLKENLFHAETIVANDLLSISQLRQILGSLLGHCELCYPPHYTTLYTIDDWHEHDGHITDRRLTTFQSFTGYGFDLFEIKKRLSIISNIKLKIINSVKYFNNRYSE